MNTTGVTALQVRSLADPLNEVAIAKLGEALPEYVATRRWFRAKTRTIDKIDVEDALPLPGTQAHLLILNVQYAAGESDKYILPVAIGPESAARAEESLARVRAESGEEGTLYSALEDDSFRDVLLNLIVCETRIEGQSGVLKATRTGALRDNCDASAGARHVESFVSRAEQSNTSIIYRDRYILKLFRKLESGTNPDVEIGTFLTARGFKNTPAVLGSLEYQSKNDEESYGAGLLQQFVPNKGDAWKYTLESLQNFFERALTKKRTPPRLQTEHPIELIGQEIPTEIRTPIESYLRSASLLGKRTAEMHASLADAGAGPDFKPEPFTAENGRRLYGDLTGQADTAFELLRRKQSVLTGPVGESAQKLLAIERAVSDRFAAVREHPISTVRIRHHGDYHLGQVLYTGQDFMIIDFEGEPARPLAERRAKALALRDVAGMVRSFQYAAFAALFGQVPGISDDPAIRPLVEAWAAAWTAFVSAAYLRSYFETAGNAAFVPAGWKERRILLDAFLLQKALYEVAYELNNRPEWLQIPLRGILSLMGA